ncbi:MAG TPA: DHA2 family efflux MFS transporter permease subunit [Dehalococcoidia bacterium]|nr:DHA2 family efflux MFS transporter permease subunit [Dehalococcoidia bacterium]
MSYKWKVLIVAIGGTFMMMLDSTIVNIALPHILAVFGDTIDKEQFVTSAYLLAMAASAPLAKFLMTRFGVKRIFIGAEIGFLLGSMFCGISWSTDSLILFRIIQGFSSGVLMPLAMTLIFTNVPPEERGTTMGFFGAPMVLAPAIGVTLGGYLVEYWSWRWCFYVNLPIVFVAVIISIVWLRDTSKTADLPLDLKGFILAAAGFSTLLYALTYAPSWGWGDARTLGFFATSLISLTAWTIVELQAKTPLLELRVFKFRGYSLGTLMNFVATLGLFSAMLLLPLFLQSVRGMDAFQAGLLMVPQAVGVMAGSVVGGRVYDKSGARPPVILGLLMASYATWRLSALDITTPDSTFAMIITLRGIGIGLVMMPVMTFTLAEVPLALVSAASTISNVLRSVFGGLSTAIFASLLHHYQQTNLAVLAQTATPDSGDTLKVLSTAQVALQKMGMSLQEAHQGAIALLYQLTALKAAILAFDRVFAFGAVILGIGIVPALLLHSDSKAKEKIKDAAAIE